MISELLLESLIQVQDFQVWNLVLMQAPKFTAVCSNVLVTKYDKRCYENKDTPVEATTLRLEFQMRAVAC